MGNYYVCIYILTYGIIGTTCCMIYTFHIEVQSICLYILYIDVESLRTGGEELRKVATGDHT